MPHRILLALATAAVLGGCGGNDDEVAAPSAAPTATPGATGPADSASNTSTAARNIAKALAMPEPRPVDIDPCTLVTAEEVDGLLKGIEASKSRGGDASRPFRECFHTGGTMGLNSVLVAVAGGLDPEQFEAYVMGNADLTGDVANVRTIEGTGSKAYWHRDFLWVHAAPHTFYVSVSVRDMDAQVALDTARRLATQVISRL